MDDERLVEVYWARDAIDAHTVHALLDEIGIPAIVEGEMLQGAVGELAAGPATSPRVRVAGADESRALAAIREWEEQQRPEDHGPREAWKCVQCGEQIEGQFEICWKCESPRDDRENPTGV